MFTLELPLFKYIHAPFDRNHRGRWSPCAFAKPENRRGTHLREPRVFSRTIYEYSLFYARRGRASGFKTERTLKRRAEPVR